MKWSSSSSSLLLLIPLCVTLTQNQVYCSRSDSSGAKDKLTPGAGGQAINFIIETQKDNNNDDKGLKIQVLYDSSGIDKEFQNELLQTVFVALRELDEDDLQPEFIDLAKAPRDGKYQLSVHTVAEWVLNNQTTTLISLICENELKQFSIFYNNLHLINNPKSKQSSEYSSNNRNVNVLKIFTPRLIENMNFPSNVKVLSLQMNHGALTIALLNRVEKVGITTLIPVLDSDEMGQSEILQGFISSGEERLKKIQFTRPIFIDNAEHLRSFTGILDEYTGFSKDNLRQHDNNTLENESSSRYPTIGVLMLASKGSHIAMRLAADKRHMQIGWFSPNILQHEEWAYRSNINNPQNSSQLSTSSTTEDYNMNKNEGNLTLQDYNPYFGLYTVAFVGSLGWDNPGRRRVLRELTSFTGASPRVLSAVLAYDSAWVAVNNVRKLFQQIHGLSGEIGFDSDGFRRDGIYFGMSAVPELSSPVVTLLQPSTWILEDTISIMETIEGQFLINDYEVATSSVLTKKELEDLANQTQVHVDCEEHVMHIVTHDPFNQMPYNYYFKQNNLPESLLVPNQHGFGITFLCIHERNNKNVTRTKITEDDDNVTDSNSSDDSSEQKTTTTLQIACTPGLRISEPIKCFRSHYSTRQKRSPENIPQTQYQYGFGASSDLWNPQNSKWSIPKDESTTNYYYQRPAFSYTGPTTPNYYGIRRADSVAASSDPTTTPASPTSKLPELRQILKAAKPFVGSCIGSTTGCAMCVLVLGRLPLGAVPAACTGPCFVGTFGSCGSLLGRVFSETTVICTELFKQGILDPETFVADAEFGRMMFNQFPITLKGYQLLATPIVDAMKSSTMVTNIVSTFAVPWSHHMKYLMGRSNEVNVFGLIVHTLGFPLCNIVGQIYTTFGNYSDSIFNSFCFVVFLFLSTVILLNSNIITRSSSKYKKQNAATYYKSMAQSLINYVKAFGRIK